MHVLNIKKANNSDYPGILCVSVKCCRTLYKYGWVVYFFGRWRYDTN